MVGYVILASNLYLVAVVDDEPFFFNGRCRNGVGYQILYWNNAINPALTSHLLRHVFKSSIVVHIEAISKEPDWTGAKKKYCIKMPSSSGCEKRSVVGQPIPFHSGGGCIASSTPTCPTSMSKEREKPNVSQWLHISLSVNGVCYRKHPSDHHSGVPCVHECHVSLIPNPASSRLSLISRLSRLMLSTSSRHTAFINHIISPPTHHR